MEVVKKSEISVQEYVKQVTVNAGCEDGGHCKYCINQSNYSN